MHKSRTQSETNITNSFFFFVFQIAEDTLLRHGNTIQEICSKSKEVEKLLPLLPSTKNKLSHLKESWDAIQQIVSRIGPPLSLVIGVFMLLVPFRHFVFCMTCSLALKPIWYTDRC